MSFNAELMHSEDLFCKEGTQPEKLFMNQGKMKVMILILCSFVVKSL